MIKADGVLKHISIFDKNTLLKNPDKFWNDIRAVGEKAFSNIKIETLSIPEGVSLCLQAFKNNKKIKNIVLPDTLEIIPAECFCGSIIENINIPENVTGIGVHAFAECTKLKHITLPNGIKTIYEGAFFRSGLKEIAIPKSVQTIQESAFMFNEYLERIILETDKINMDWSSFQNCPNIKTIKLGENTFTIPNNYHFYTMFRDSGKNLIVTVKDENEKFGMAFLDERQIIFVPNIDQNFLEKIDMFGEEYDYSLLKVWQQQKQNNPSNAVKKMPLPEYAVMSAIGDDKQLINSFFKTKTNGYDILKDKYWYKDLCNSAKSCIIRLFASMGGFEENAAHQKRVVEILDKYIKYLNSMCDWGNIDDAIIDNFETIPQGLDHIKTKVTEYEHDKDNKIVYKNGFPVIKCEKTVKFYKQICDFFEKNYYRKNFDVIANNVVVNYPLIHKHYKKQLAKLNPNRNPNGNLEKYNQLKQNGIDIKFVLSCNNAFKFFYKNDELIEGLENISEYDLDQELVTAYDKYLTEAKKITKKQLKKMKE